MTADISTRPDGQRDGGEMNGTIVTPALNEALAKFQAALPRVTKGETANVPGKEGKRGYSYSYADLADISQVALPLLGKFGLAFTAKPTMRDGAFVLHYKLTHSSGETDEGFYFLPSPDRTAPQQVGSAITYARRYCLCAVTGIHPDGEDDDGQAAQQAAQTAGDAWENAAPAQPRNGNGNDGNRSNRPAGSVSRPAAARKPAAGPDGEVDKDAQQYADEAHEARSLPALRDAWTNASKAKKLNATVADPATGEKQVLSVLVETKRKALAEVESALRELNEAADAHNLPAAEMDLHVKQVTGADIESATADQLRQAAAALAGAPA